MALLCLLPGAPEASIHADGAARPTQPAATTGTYSALVLFAKFAGEAAGDWRMNPPT